MLDREGRYINTRRESDVTDREGRRVYVQDNRCKWNVKQNTNPSSDLLKELKLKCDRAGALNEMAVVGVDKEDNDFDSLFDTLQKKADTPSSKSTVKSAYWTPDFTVTLPDLNDEQQTLLNSLMEMVRTDTVPKVPVIISGSGGSGKTLLLAHFQRELFNAGYTAPACSYTNKAVSVLKARGIAARTIHRTLYQTKIYEEVEPITQLPPLQEMEIKNAPTRGNVTLKYNCFLRGMPATQGEVAKIYLHNKHIFYRNPFAEDMPNDIIDEWYKETGGNPVTHEVPRTDVHDILLMDEFSMVTRRWYDQARQQFKHIFLFGDLMQLPPIEDEGIDVSRAVMFTLHRTMRTQTLQEEQQYVRRCGQFPIQNTPHFVHTREMTAGDVAEKIANNPVNVAVLVWRNVTRQRINLLCNPDESLAPNVPVAVVMSTYDVHEDSETDEMMLERKPFMADMSDWYSGCTYSKSERLVIDSIRRHSQFPTVSVVTFHGHWKPAYIVQNKADFFRYRYIPFSKEAMRVYKPEGQYPIPLLWVELAYAQTCHKWQGSEVKNLIIVNEIRDEIADAWKWRYTAITRASEKCIVVKSLK